MATCSNCGNDLKEGERFCTRCGAPVEAPGVPAPPAQPPVGPPVAPPLQPPVQQPVPPPVPPQTGDVYGAPPPDRYGAPKAKKGLPKGAKVAIIAAVVIVVLIAGIIGLGVAFFWNAITAPADVANDYVEAVNEGNLSTAWDYLSSEAQDEEGRAGFEEKVGDLEGQIETWNVRSVNVKNNRASVIVDLEGKGGEEATWNMELVKEEGDWKILVYRLSD